MGWAEEIQEKGLIVILLGYSELRCGNVNENICGLSAECFGWNILSQEVKSILH